MDGTLSDSETLHWRAYSNVLQREFPTFPANPISRRYYNTNIGGRTKSSSVSQILPNLPPSEISRICVELEREFEGLARKDLKCLPGVKELLQEVVCAGKKIALVTNAPPTEMAFSLACLDLTNWFDVKVAAGHAPQPKPHPAPYIEGLRQLGVKAEEAIAFEDSLAGVRSAVAAGLITVGITTSQPAEELVGAGAAVAVPDMADPRLRASLQLALRELPRTSGA